MNEEEFNVLKKELKYGRVLRRRIFVLEHLSNNIAMLLGSMSSIKHIDVPITIITLDTEIEKPESFIKELYGISVEVYVVKAEYITALLKSNANNVLSITCKYAGKEYEYEEIIGPVNMQRIDKWVK